MQTFQGVSYMSLAGPLTGNSRFHISPKRTVCRPARAKLGYKGAGWRKRSHLWHPHQPHGALRRSNILQRLSSIAHSLLFFFLANVNLSSNGTRDGQTLFLRFKGRKKIKSKTTKKRITRRNAGLFLTKTIWTFTGSSMRVKLCPRRFWDGGDDAGKLEVNKINGGGGGVG